MGEETKVYCDTSILRDALCWVHHKDNFLKQIKGDVDHDLRLSSSRLFWSFFGYQFIRLFYSSLTDVEMPEKLDGPWQELKRRMQKTTVVSARANGIYLADGSVSSGSVHGGGLRCLNDPGFDVSLLKAAKQSREEGTDKPYMHYRRREFDFDHVEAALEMKADYFITNDRRLMRRIRSAPKNIVKQNITVKLAKRIVCTPQEALTKISLS
jgi:hypothetical protein